MTRDDVLRMAREAGCNDEFVNMAPCWLERFAAMVADAEREACAETCIKEAQKGQTREAGALACAIAIRARK